MDMYDCSNTLKSTYNCKACNGFLQTKVNLKIHHKTGCDSAVPLVKKMNCLNCFFKTFSRLILLRNHYECYSRNKRTQLPKGAMLSNQLRKTIEEDHCYHAKKVNYDIWLDHNYFRRERWLRCDFCGYKSKWDYTMRKHLLSRHASYEDIDWFQCENCNYKCRQMRQLKNHIKMTHLKPKKTAIKQ